MRKMGLWSALLLLGGGAAFAAAPSYSATSFYSAVDQSTGPFAPNSVVVIKGSGLARSAQGLTAADVASGTLPTSLNGVQVFVDNSPAPLFYVSDAEIEFLMPTNEIAGQSTVWVSRESTPGPVVTIALSDIAPSLFPSTAETGYVAAQRWPDYSAVSTASPIHPGGFAILYAGGLGLAQFYPAATTEIPRYAGLITQLQNFQVYLNGKAINQANVLYAGLCPGWPGLYQINLIVPWDAGTNPEIRIGIGSKLSTAGLKLAVQ